MIHRIRATLEYHPLVLFLLFGTALSRIVTSMSLPYLTIYLTKQTDMGPTAVGITVGAGALAGMIFGFIGGALSDRYSRQTVMNVSVFVWAIVFLLFAWNSIAWVFVVLNMLNGICRATFEPVSVALIGDLTSIEKRHRVYAIRYTVINIGASIGPIIGAVMGFVGGSSAFVVSGMFFVLYGLVLTLLFKRYRVGGQHTQVKAATSQLESGLPIRAALQVAAKDRTLLWFISGGMLMQFVYSQVNTISPYVERHFAEGALLFSILLTVNAVTVVICQIPLTVRMEKLSSMASVSIGNTLYAVGGIGFALADSWLMMIAAMVVFSIGEVLCFPALNIMTDRIAPEHLRGAYFGAQNFRDIGRFAGPAIGLPLLEHFGAMPLFIVVAGVCLLSSWCYVLGERRRSLVAMVTMNGSVKG